MGSFYNVVAYRFHAGLSLTRPRKSICPFCAHSLSFLDLIPILSYLSLGGRCRYCKKRISPFYPVVEFISASLFLLSYLKFGFTYKLLISLLISSFLVIVIHSDFRYGEIDDKVNILFSILILIINIITKRYNYLWESLIVFLIIYVFFKITSKIYKKDTLGGGDIKLMLFIGLAFGLLNSFLVLFLASLIALPYGLLMKRKTGISSIPFGPFILLAAFLIYFYQLDFITLLI